MSSNKSIRTIMEQTREYKAKLDGVTMAIPKKPKKEDYIEIEAYDKELQDMIFEDNLMEMRL